jgi:hypothetical protein
VHEILRHGGRLFVCTSCAVPSVFAIHRTDLMGCCVDGLCLCHYRRPYCDELERVGFFAANALPAMLESSLAHVE